MFLFAIHIISSCPSAAVRPIVSCSEGKQALDLFTISHVLQAAAISLLSARLREPTSQANSGESQIQTGQRLPSLAYLLLEASTPTGMRSQQSRKLVLDDQQTSCRQ